MTLEQLRRLKAMGALESLVGVEVLCLKQTHNARMEPVYITKGTRHRIEWFNDYEHLGLFQTHPKKCAHNKNTVVSIQELAANFRLIKEPKP